MCDSLKGDVLFGMIVKGFPRVFQGEFRMEKYGAGPIHEARGRSADIPVREFQLPCAPDRANRQSWKVAIARRLPETPPGFGLRPPSGAFEDRGGPRRSQSARGRAQSKTLARLR